MPRNNIYTKSFYWRNGLKIMPSQNFIDKFKEFYNELLYNNKARANKPPLDDQTAIFFINIVLENIITILDFGYSFIWGRMIAINNKIITCHLGTENAPKRMWNNVKKISFKLYEGRNKKIKAKINSDNQEYIDYIKLKSERYGKILDYYKEYYGKQNDWWQ